ncbi:hypothetical protein A7A08_01693 [Methyloligella halotolerans]|uniref:Uncharacterized protein n=1 Tax=Methyloligella halotolerans TaxID=1177755 RepID=A0A1E2RZZ4_9HYPH|nr:hypothetical protein [Methyloligella halotolerans]ODA67658.1 hypothetical protein A7A08_01693 [Methyloligella halotolerans]
MTDTSLLFGCWNVDVTTGEPAAPAVPVVRPQPGRGGRERLERALWRTRSTKAPYGALRERYRGEHG